MPVVVDCCGKKIDAQMSYFKMGEKFIVFIADIWLPAGPVLCR